MRIENDALGPVEIPNDVAWGPQTERSRQHFSHGPVMPVAVIRALLQLKQAEAQVAVATRVKLVPATIAAAISTVCQALLAQSNTELMKNFPLHVYQTGSGTQTNMNVNEVVAHLATIKAGQPVLPNDHVNAGQSSNDDFPTAMALAAYPAVTAVSTALAQLQQTFTAKAATYQDTVKLGRTHLQDATPLTFGQEVSGWTETLATDQATLTALQPQLLALPLGGTAVGTGLNTTPTHTQAVVAELVKLTGTPVTVMPNAFHGLTSHSELTSLHGVFKTIATDLMKIANDIRFLASGPRSGYGELTIPANEPGSSIMPGKVNPTQAEALTMACARVMGNDVTLAVANSQGNFELNVYKPVIIATFLESADLLAGCVTNFDTYLAQGLTANATHMRALVDQSLMLVTALSPHIGYAASAKIAQTAQHDGCSLRQAALASGQVTATQYDEWVDPLAMTRGGIQQ